MKKLQEPNGIKTIESLPKKCEIVDPSQDVCVQFTMHEKVVVRTQPMRPKKGKLKPGTKKLIKKYKWKVVINLGRHSMFVVLFKSRDKASSFAYQLFFSEDDYKWVFDTDEAFVYSVY